MSYPGIACRAVSPCIDDVDARAASAHHALAYGGSCNLKARAEDQASRPDDAPPSLVMTGVFVDALNRARRHRHICSRQAGRVVRNEECACSPSCNPA